LLETIPGDVHLGGRAEVALLYPEFARGQVIPYIS